MQVEAGVLEHEGGGASVVEPMSTSGTDEVLEHAGEEASIPEPEPSPGAGVAIDRDEASSVEAKHTSHDACETEGVATSSGTQFDLFLADGGGDDVEATVATALLAQLVVADRPANLADVDDARDEDEVWKQLLKSFGEGGSSHGSSRQHRSLTRNDSGHSVASDMVDDLSDTEAVEPEIAVPEVIDVVVSLDIEGDGGIARGVFAYRHDHHEA
jgi:hypothetical protein